MLRAFPINGFYKPKVLMQVTRHHATESVFTAPPLLRTAGALPLIFLFKAFKNN